MTSQADNSAQVYQLYNMVDLRVILQTGILYRNQFEELIETTCEYN